MKLTQMKRYNAYTLLSLLCSTLFMLTSCVGEVEPELPASNLLTLVTDIPYANVDNGETITFRVKLDGVLLSKAVVDIVQLDENDQETLLDGMTFTPAEVGTYRFKAKSFEYVTEDELEITAYDASQITNSFLHRHIVHKFTATWCTNCPAMGESLHAVSEAMPLQLIEIATHCNELAGAAELEVSAGAELDALFSVKGTYPTIVLDYDATTKSTSTSTVTITNTIESNNATYPVVSGVKIASVLDGTALSIEVAATVQEANDYRIGVLLVQDNYAYTQYGSTSDYRQDYVLRGYLTDIEGDDLGTLAANSEIRRTYTTQIEESALSAECRIVAFIYNKQTNGGYIVNNATQCVVGGDVPYLYEFK